MPPIDGTAFYRRDASAGIVRLDGETMGTNWSAQIAAPPDGAAAAIAAELGAVIASMSHWVPDSAVSRFNDGAIGEWATLPADLTQVIDCALAVARASGGAFDPAIGVLADLWGFGPPGPIDRAPTSAEVAQAHYGLGAIERDDHRTRRTRPVRIDLSGIAKGHAVDRLASGLERLGARDFLIEIGGEFVGRGIRPDGQPWWVELEDPPGMAFPALRIALHGVAVATSGNYRRYVDAGGRRLGHTIDPRTGRPIASGITSVSVIAADCMTADAWATALTVLGPDEGMRIAQREGLATRLVLSGGDELLSPALQAMLDG